MVSDYLFRCYQLPSLVLPGVTVVISPLVALMYDQTTEMQKIGLNAAQLKEGTPEAAVQAIYEALDAVCTIANISANLWPRIAVHNYRHLHQHPVHPIITVIALGEYWSSVRNP